MRYPQPILSSARRIMKVNFTTDSTSEDHVDALAASLHRLQLFARPSPGKSGPDVRNKENWLKDKIWDLYRWPDVFAGLDLRYYLEKMTVYNYDERHAKDVGTGVLDVWKYHLTISAMLSALQRYMVYLRSCSAMEAESSAVIPLI